ncbi:MAG TPA: type I-MYXAN CRISPR-associated protein Cas6/Cmx6 [Pyrinomonadaceae bacterium]|jgi:CRISPR-associated protein Cas6|nr:type I-MYXAN CRISPR-associated protein Cas6/Cmx6 [Pyrinomonadaceae bacterium]
MSSQNAVANAINIASTPYIGVHFPVQGHRFEADHGYLLYSAITRQLPALHGASWLGIELISGVPWREGIIVLPTRDASLRLRIPADQYGNVLPLAGRRLDINGHTIRLGVPTARPLEPAASLYARCVTIKKFTDAEPFLDAARRQLDALGVIATLELPIDEQGRFRRRIITIAGKHVVGFSLAAHNLNDEDSLRLQSSGIGGRRAMGAGHFNPIVSSALLAQSKA